MSKPERKLAPMRATPETVEAFLRLVWSDPEAPAKVKIADTLAVLPDITLHSLQLILEGKAHLKEMRDPTAGGKTFLVTVLGARHG